MSEREVLRCRRQQVFEAFGVTLVPDFMQEPCNAHAAGIGNPSS